MGALSPWVERPYTPVTPARSQGGLGCPAASRILEFEMTAGPGLAARRAPSALPPALGALAELEFRLGDWAAAHDAAGEALRGARRVSSAPRSAAGSRGWP